MPLPAYWKPMASATRAARPGRFALTAMLLLAAFLLLLGWALWRQPPELARLLPEADAIVYADLRPARLLLRLNPQPVAHSPDFQRFIDQTGILPERDLEQTAFALHRMPDPSGPNGLVGYSELLSGHFDRERLVAYLRSIAASEETYAGHEILLIPISLPPGGTTPPAARTLRIAVLDRDTVAASNMPTAEQMHAMLDHARGPHLLAGGPSLLGHLYSELPVASTAWGVGELALPFADTGHVALLGLSLPIPPRQPMLASLRYTTALQLRLELLAGSDSAAITQADALRSLLDVVRAIGLGPASTAASPPAAELVRSVTISPEHDRTLIRATVSPALLRTLAGSG